MNGLFIALIKNRLIVFLSLLVTLILIGGVFNLFSPGLLFGGSLFPTASTQDLWFYSGIVMLTFSILFIEPYYSSPKNVITNVVPLLLVLLSIGSEFKFQVHWLIAIIFLIIVLTFSVLAMFLYDENDSPDSIKNNISTIFKKISVVLGKGRYLYSAVFLYFFFTYYVNKEGLSLYVFVMFLMWALILLIQPGKLTNNLNFNKKLVDKSAIGKIFGIESNKMFLVKIFKDNHSLNKFDIVKFNYSTNNENRPSLGIVFDYYKLDQDRWIKVLYLDGINNSEKVLDRDIVYKVPAHETLNMADLRIKDFVGVVCEDSKIGRLKFQYSKQINNLYEGDLIELKIGDIKVFYQVIAGTTGTEQLEAHNEASFIIGEAIQIGFWDNEKDCFAKFGWIPTINTPIFLANTDDIKPNECKYPECKIGIVPGTTLPSIINLNDAVSHHMALIGVTGSGKSYLARKLIKEMMNDTKVICIDFTGEYVDKLSDLKPRVLVDKKGADDTETILAQKDAERARGRSSDATILLEYKKKIQEKLQIYVKSFIESDDMLGIFELPDMSNSTFILEFTQQFLDAIFQYAKNNKGSKICIVLEEAHTVVPETNSLGDLGDFGSNKAIVSKIGQIALQGRKYGVGFLVIAQRTANVSKTVLTQCNTVICFQAFDETSFGFLSNYVGKEMVGALPTLPQYHAVVAGKAMKTNTPMIVDLTQYEDN